MESPGPTVVKVLSWNPTLQREESPHALQSTASRTTVPTRFITPVVNCSTLSSRYRPLCSRLCNPCSRSPVTGVVIVPWFASPRPLSLFWGYPRDIGASSHSPATLALGSLYDPYYLLQTLKTYHRRCSKFRRAPLLHLRVNICIRDDTIQITTGVSSIPVHLPFGGSTRSSTGCTSTWEAARCQAHRAPGRFFL